MKCRRNLHIFAIIFLVAASGLLFINVAEALTPTPPTVTPLPTPIPIPTLLLEQRVVTAEARIEDIEEKLSNPQKDIWDKLEAISGLVTGGLIALIGLVVTYVYREREQRAEKAHNERELAILQVQTVQRFMPQLQSEDEKAVGAALKAIAALGNPKLATELAAIYGSEGAVSALSKLASSPDPATSRKARESLGKVFTSLRSAVVEISSGDIRKGAGFFVKPEGYIVTVDFLFQDKDEDISIVLGPKTYKAHLISRDPDAMLALLRVEDGQFPFLPITDEVSVHLLDEIFILVPDPDLGWTVSTGQVTGIDVRLKSRPRLLLIGAQIGAKRGYAGAPVVNQKGQVIGVIAMRTVESNYAFLVPTTSVKGFVERTFAGRT